MSSGRSLYRALGIENAHQRRLGSPALLWRRLLTLDCLLAHPDANWLATGEEKLLHFLKRGYDLEDLPQRRLGNRALDHITLSPIAVDERSVSFVFPDPGPRNQPGALLLGFRPPVPLGGAAPRRRSRSK